MCILKNLEPRNVFRFFEELSAIPHGSGNTKAISDYCVSFAVQHGFQYWQDGSNNVIIVKPASAGMENAPAVILQGHLDMVCEKTPDCPLDMEKDGLVLHTDGNRVWAENTTLGGDNGIAVAMALAALDADDLQHPRLEAVFTTDEEIGLLGAAALDVSPLQGKLMLNMDSEVEGILTVSCAGGVRANCHIPVQWETAEGVIFDVEITGLIGGHSGVEIHKGRANASVLMGRLLYGLQSELNLKIAALTGGLADNAISSHTVCTVLLAEEDRDRFAEIVRSNEAVFSAEYQTADPGMQIRLIPKELQAASVLQQDAADRLVSALMILPNGIQSMSMDISGLVQTSLNLGILRLEKKEAVLSYALRSSVASEKAMVCNKLECLCKLLGGCVSYSGDYPAWEYKKDSVLRELVSAVYEEQQGKRPVVEAIHAGLECGVFAGKIPGLDCVSLGPDLFEIHTPREQMSVSSVARTWQLLCEVLRRVGELK